MNDTLIHPTAIISRDAVLQPGVRVGPGAVIEGGVEIDAATVIGPYAIIHSQTRIGANNVIGAHAVIGGDPQHAAYAGSDSFVEIGNDNVLREFVTVNRAFEPGAATRIGSNCFLMTGVHVGHDCTVGDNATFTTNVLLAGHVEVGHHVVMGGGSVSHQFIRIGSYCMVAGFVPLRKDALPFTLVGGSPVRHYRLNTIGLRRNGITGDRYRALESAFRSLRAGDRSLDGVPDTEEVKYLRQWLSVRSKYGQYGFLTRKQR
ncbi:MAG: acyl-ACP--UDP-N-acetylglucosamine O-acyltransferase [Planctomycetes bacterium]|jgi:UDP-N-acetylglucosamine acyltransferase|nr:acyl-ACP--UDP-N-acetylglucosamine O-acyltransferase [Planctomycetota bacterium]